MVLGKYSEVDNRTEYIVDSSTSKTLENDQTNILELSLYAIVLV